MQEEVIEHLMQPDVLSAQERITQIMPILDFLSYFSKVQQENWASEYVQNLPLLLKYEADLLIPACHHQLLPPMAYSHVKSMSLLARQYATANQSANQLFEQIVTTVADQPEQRRRMFTRWESWALHLEKAQASHFLHDFCQVMQQFDDNNWQTLVQLVDKTQQWWHKDRLGSYYPQLIALWSKLGRTAGDFPEGLNWCLALSGKEWFMTMSALLELTSEQINTHSTQLQTLWQMDAAIEPPLKKQQRIREFTLVCNRLQQFYKTQLFAPAKPYTTIFNPRSLFGQVCQSELLIGTHWTLEQNKRLLSKIYGYYTEQSTVILGKKTASMQSHKLPALLQLTQELSLVAREKETLFKNIEPLLGEVNTLLTDYQFIRKKSQLRGQRTAHLQATVETLFTSKTATPENILAIIHETKCQILKDDLERNANRWFYRTSQSRLYKVLDKIENRILRQWTQHMEPVQSLKIYEEHFKQHVLALGQQLQTSCNGYRKSSSVLSHFSLWQNGQEKQMQLFQHALKQFLAKAPNDCLQEIRAVRSQLSVLPRHMYALANQLLVKSQHLSQYLDVNKPTVAPKLH